MSTTGKLEPNRYTLHLLLGAALVLLAFLVYLVWPLLLPMLLAGAIAQLSYRMHRKLTRVFRGHKRLAAIVMTTLVVFLVIVPLTVVISLAGHELRGASEYFQEEEVWQQPIVKRGIAWLQSVGYLDEEYPPDALIEKGRTLVSESGMAIYNQTWRIATGIGQILLGLGVFIVSLYYFYAEGPQFIASIDKLSLLDRRVDRALYQQFDRVCDAVIKGTLVSALGQALLGGLGFWISGVSGIWLLACLTFFSSMIPFMGPAAIWIPVAIWLLVQGSYGKAIFLSVWGALVIGTSDNLIRAYVIGDRARLHPLVVFVSVIGGIRVVGLWGVFVGPIVAGFVHAMLKILKRRIRLMRRGGDADLPVKQVACVNPV